MIANYRQEYKAMKPAPLVGHTASAAEKATRIKGIPARRYANAVTPAPRMRDCTQCGRPFFSRSAGNVVCVVCRAESTARFEGEL